jgi:hypothetical protein
MAAWVASHAPECTELTVEGGTEGSNPAPSSAESVSAVKPGAVGEPPAELTKPLLALQPASVLKLNDRRGKSVDRFEKAS